LFSQEVTRSGWDGLTTCSCSDRVSLLFVGPSISAAELAQIVLPGIEVRPPIKRGDLPRALSEQNVTTVAIIDGEFFQNLAVSPKEILSALNNNTVVIGGASMGALRAVELSPYGMEGIGQVFDWYKKGIVTRDDDVALSYGVRSDSTFMLCSVPMVQVMWTVQVGKRQGWLSLNSAEKTLRTARRFPWRTRTWEQILTSASITPDEFNRLTETSVQPENDIKRLDAIATVAKLNIHHLRR